MGRPYWQARNEAEVTTTSATVYSDTADLTFTPLNGSKRHLIIVSGAICGGSTTTSIDVRLYNNTAASVVDGLWTREAGDTSPLEYELWKQYILWTSPATPVSQNFILQFKSNSGTTTTRRLKQAGIVVIELDDADYAQESLARSTTTDNTWPGATKQTLSFNPASTGDYLILQSNVWDMSTANDSCLTALGLDGAYMINDAVPVTAAICQDTRDLHAHTWLWKQNITTGSTHSITSEFLVALGVSATVGVSYDRLFALRLDLFAGNTYAEDNTKTSNTNSTYDTALSVAPSTINGYDYLLLSDSIVEYNSTTVSMKGRIQKDGVTVFGETACEMGGLGYGTQTGSGYIYTGDGTTDTWNIDMQTESGTAAHFFYGAMILLSLSGINSPLLSMTMNGPVPSIAEGKNILPPLASLQLSGAISKQSVEVFPPTVQLKLSGFTPALIVDVPVNLLSMSGVLQSPTATTVASGIVTAVDILPPGGAFTLISLDPSIAAGKNIQSPLSSIILSGFSPDIVAGKNIQPPQGDLILEAIVPNVVAGKNLLPTSGTITMSLIAPDIAAGKNIQPPGLTMIMDGLSPSVLNGVAIDADTGIWTMEAFAPVIGGALHISVDEFFMIMEGFAATVPGVGITRGRSGSVNLREGVSQTRGATFAEIIDGVGIEKVELE